MATVGLEAGILAVVKTVCARAFFDVAPKGTVTPYVVLTQYAAPAGVYGDGTRHNTRRTRLQISVWAKARAESTQTLLAVEDALHAAPNPAGPLFNAEAMNTPMTTYDEDVSLYGAMIDFDVTGVQ